MESKCFTILAALSLGRHVPVPTQHTPSKQTTTYEIKNRLATANTDIRTQWCTNTQTTLETAVDATDEARERPPTCPERNDKGM
jgi:hypothetical protein